MARSNNMENSPELSKWGRFRTVHFGACVQDKKAMACVIPAFIPVNEHAQSRMLGGIFHFYSSFIRTFCKQTVESLIRRLVWSGSALFAYVLQKGRLYGLRYTSVLDFCPSSSSSSSSSSSTSSSSSSSSSSSCSSYLIYTGQNLSSLEGGGLSDLSSLKMPLPLRAILLVHFVRPTLSIDSPPLSYLDLISSSICLLFWLTELFIKYSTPRNCLMSCLISHFVGPFPKLSNRKDWQPSFVLPWLN